MATSTKSKPGFEKWKDTINKSAGDSKWDAYDCEIRMAVNEFNLHLAGKAGYSPLDWQLIKAIAWVETGACKDLWKTNPMQIGMYNDPGLKALLSNKEGGDLILPPLWRSTLTIGSARTIPSNNIRAGIGYLLMKLANFSIKSVPDADTHIYEVTVKTGDSFDKIAKTHGSTLEELKQLNPAAQILHPGQVLKYKKATMKKVIVGWKPITTLNVASYYNCGGDPMYSKKLDYALSLLRKRKATVCTH